MNFKEELLERIYIHRRLQQRGLSEEAAEELREAVRANPETFLTNPEDKAFKHLGEVLEREDALRSEEEFMDDDAFEAARKSRVERIRSGCQEALEIASSCVDAQTILALTSSEDANEIYLALDKMSPVHIELDYPKPNPDIIEPVPPVLMKPYRRYRSALALWALNTTRYSIAREISEDILELDSDDPYGARYILAVVLARLEQEEAFNELDQRLFNAGNAWSNLARALLMFKLDRMSAARRALKTYDRFNKGGAYALLRPVYVETYLPDRPHFEPGSFEEAVLAVHECDPIIMDTPDFIPWCQSQDDFAGSAQAFAQANDLDW